MAFDTPRSQRQLRVGELLRHSIAEYFSRHVFYEEELYGKSVTVSEVRISPDLKNATIFVMPLGGEGKEVIEEALNKQSSSIRYKVAPKVKLRNMPKFRFKIDESFDQASKVNSLLGDSTVKQDISG